MYEKLVLGCGKKFLVSSFANVAVLVISRPEKSFSKFGVLLRASPFDVKEALSAALKLMIF